VLNYASMGNPKSNRKLPLATARGEATKARIVQAAVALVAARGVAGTTIDDVMEASKTSKSQIYHYFNDKEALLCAVVKAQSDRILGFQESCLSGVNSLEGLRQWRDQIVRLTGDTHGIGGCPLGSLASALADQSEQARDLLAKSFQRWEAQLATSLIAMQDRGALNPSVKPCDLATAIVGALQGGLLLAQTARSTKPLELALDMVLEHISNRSVSAQPM
jgi:TetR/AcrR family transcriptional repressor of nem operon